jgi:hypothetical protein
MLKYCTTPTPPHTQGYSDGVGCNTLPVGLWLKTFGSGADFDVKPETELLEKRNFLA